MTNHVAVRRGSWWKSARLRAFLSLGVVLGIGSVGTFAYWTDSVTVSGTTFTAGTIDLKVNNLDTVTGYTSLNIANMVPGNSTAGILIIKNNSTTTPMKYAASTTATDVAPNGLGLGAALVVKVTNDTTTTGAAPAATCAGTAATGMNTTLNTSLTTTGRLLAPSAIETLCVQVTLPVGANTNLQGGATNVVFTFLGTSDLT